MGRLKGMVMPSIRQSSIFLMPIGIMLVFQNGVDVWRYGAAYFESPLLALVVFSAVLFGLLGFLIFSKVQARQVLNVRVASLVLLLCAIYFIPDSRYPAKKIHIPEYFLIGSCAYLVLTRAFVSTRHRLWAALIYVSFIGVHDEVIQGLLPDRYFSYIDIIVNISSGAVGTAFAMELTKKEPLNRSRVNGLVIFNLVIAFAAVGMLVFVLWRFKGVPVPFWSVLPLTGAAVNALLSVKEAQISGEDKRLYLLGLVLSVTLGLYVIGSHVFALSFD